MSQEINLSPVPPNNSGSFKPKVLLSPAQAHRNRIHPPSPDDTAQVSLHIAQMVATDGTTTATNRQTPAKDLSAKQKQLQKIQGSLIVVAVLAAGASYTAGVNPPGGFWQESEQGHTAGMPVLRDTDPYRYMMFFCCNGTAFIMSLLSIFFLVDTELYLKQRFPVMEAAMTLTLFSFIGAYAAGSSGELCVSIYLYSLMGIVSLYILSYFRLLSRLIRYPSRSIRH